MQLPKAYEPREHEAKIYKLWEDSGAFQPLDFALGKPASGKGSKEPFCIILPPPNANGDLHLGHAMYVVEDIMARYRRMQGHPTLWLPGADHAGIETQVVYERLLEKQGKSRFDLGRDKFYQEVWDFTQKNMGNMYDQLRSLGFSVDWSRAKFTLDADIIEIVYDTFKRLHDDGLIYRGNRIVNWCTACQSSFADIEVKYVTRQDHLYTLDYGTVQIATTRPETIFADVAVAVNPTDERYAKLIGQTATVPLVDRPVPIIADDHVDPATGTGALKVTPGHDPNDFEIGLRHDLPQLSVIDLNGQMINVPEQFLGKSTVDGRRLTVDELKRTGKLKKTTPLSHAVGTHNRCGTVIEPLVTEQWWLRVKSLVDPAIEAIKSGEITFIPFRFKKQALDWLENLHDWNISRQNWWGIRVPVYYKTSNDPNKEAYIIASYYQEAEKYYGKGNYRAETDNFDTWFSSGQWPFASLMTTGDFERFYPTSVMETGRDILFLWVTRMIMLGIYRTGKVPFRNVYLHGLVNDAQGQKMSKSRGNVINPLEVTKKHGTDALRLALTIGITPGNDGSLSEDRIIGYRNFCNKLWNVARFTLSLSFLRMRGSSSGSAALPVKDDGLSLADKWVLHRVAESSRDVTKALESYRFSDAGQLVYSLLWDDLADWYVEASKGESNLPILVHSLETVLKLAHPMAPFVTETIWQALPWRQGNLITAEWPTQKVEYENEAKDFERLKLLISEARGIIHDLRLEKPTLVHSSKLISDNELLVAKLAGIGRFEHGQNGGLALSSLDHVWLDLDAATVRRYVDDLKTQLKDKDVYLKRLKKQLNNAAFTKSAPTKIIQDTRDRYDEALMLRSKLNEQIRQIQSV